MTFAPSQRLMNVAVTLARMVLLVWTKWMLTCVSVSLDTLALTVKLVEICFFLALQLCNSIQIMQILCRLCYLLSWHLISVIIVQLDILTLSRSWCFFKQKILIENIGIFCVLQVNIVSCVEAPPTIEMSDYVDKWCIKCVGMFAWNLHDLSLEFSAAL